jgi:hypothetical protein
MFIFLLISEQDMASGDGSTVREEIGKENPASSFVTKWLKPR